MRASAPTAPSPDQRPLLRGVFHAVAAVAAMAGIVLLALLAESPAGYVGGAVFATCLVLLYGTSATYHRIPWGPRLRAIMKRLDHSMIFILIAGTYTPICLIAASTTWGITILAVVWALAGAGVVMKLAWPDGPRWLSVLFYVGLGWISVAAAGEILAWFTLVPLALLILGGVLYTVGGIVYAAGRPNPFPSVFGYHEVFHALVIGGSVLHFILIAGYVVPA